MSTQKSTGFCAASAHNDIATSPSAIWTTMHLRLFSGTPPTSADAAETGTLLNVITNPSYAALTWAATAPAGVQLKHATDVWAGEAGDTDADTGSSATTKITSGSATATWFRFCNKADTGGISTTNPRLQGTIAEAGAELDLSSTTITFGATTTVNYCALSKTPS